MLPPNIGRKLSSFRINHRSHYGFCEAKDGEKNTVFSKQLEVFLLASRIKNVFLSFLRKNKIISQEEPLRRERKNIYVLADASNYWFSSFLIFKQSSDERVRRKFTFLIIWIYRCFEGAPHEGRSFSVICVMSCINVFDIYTTSLLRAKSQDDRNLKCRTRAWITPHLSSP